VNVYDIFEKVFARKDQPSLLSNNINHPNNFGHWLYFRAFKNLKF
jgi:acyl-CoA thioesterase-1